MSETGPAFPTICRNDTDTNQLGWEGEVIPPGGVAGYRGTNKREYAALHLRVPSSGTDWLDDMIREANRNELAADVMKALAYHYWEVRGDKGAGPCAEEAQRFAAAMLAERGRQP